MIADGCVIRGADIKRSVIGVRSMIGENVKFHNVVMMGNDAYEDKEEVDEKYPVGTPAPGVGSNCVFKNAIIDKNARIGDNVMLDPEGKDDGLYENGITIRDGILMVAKDAIVPSNTKL